MAALKYCYSNKWMQTSYNDHCRQTCHTHVNLILRHDMRAYCSYDVIHSCIDYIGTLGSSSYTSSYRVEQILTYVKRTVIPL